MLASFTLGLTAVGLSGDAFAASVARGAARRSVRVSEAIRNGLTFGGVEGLMCLGGWMLGHAFAGLVTALDHWIALALLGAIGGKMIVESFEDAEQTPSGAPPRSGFVRTVVTAIGTSVDSAAVGVALSLSGAPVYVAFIVGAVSAVISTAGFVIGPVVGAALGKRAELLGGLILVGIGIWIWTDHMFLAPG
ncbi:MAG: manganese efflux pump MntP family protein [Oceanicaulis sp.]